MIKLLLSLNSFLISFFAVSQTVDSTAVEKRIYLGVNYQSVSKYNINSNLTISNLTAVPTTLPEWIVGVSIFGKRFSGNLEIGFGGGVEGTAATGNVDLTIFTTRFNFSYNLVNKKNTAFTTGLNMALTSNEFNIFDSNANVNFNNLIPSSNSGYVRLSNTIFYVGPAASLYLFREKWWGFRLYSAYEIAVAGGRWQSPFTNTTNSVSERGNNRLVFGISF